jgi:hypothetical protein
MGSKGEGCRVGDVVNMHLVVWSLWHSISAEVYTCCYVYQQVN